MRNKLEHILLSILLGITILLGLSFWLNTFFNFNIFCPEHWDELAKLQASKTPINYNFYISIGVAIFIFTIGIFLIYRQTGKNIHKKVKEEKQQLPQQHITTIQKVPEQQQTNDIPSGIQFNRPPRLNLPNNMAQIAAQKNAQPKEVKPTASNSSTSPYNPMISEIFSTGGYTVKPNPTIAGFVPNLFAIGNNEIVWMGGVDCDIEKMTNGIQKLQSVFEKTLEDIPIHIHAFILDTMNRYDTTNDNILIFKSIEELKSFIDEHPAATIEDIDKENFDSYSEYIDK